MVPVRFVLVFWVVHAQSDQQHHPLSLGTRPGCPAKITSCFPDLRRTSSFEVPRPYLKPHVIINFRLISLRGDGLHVFVPHDGFWTNVCEVSDTVFDAEFDSFGVFCVRADYPVNVTTEEQFEFDRVSDFHFFAISRSKSPKSSPVGSRICLETCRWMDYRTEPTLVQPVAWVRDWSSLPSCR